VIDLSNHNRGTVDFRRLHKAGQERVYLKLTEGTTYLDPTHQGRRRSAHAAGLKVGEYHFARPSRHSAKNEADFFLEHLPKLVKGKDLRPVLDLEDPDASPSPAVGRWALEFIQAVRKHSGHVVVIYGSTDYLARCRFPKAPGPLWLASYGRNDGKEHPFHIPRPWTHVAAHQYTSVGRVAGVEGPCDISRVFRARQLDVAVTK
jgi:lysozyme